MNNCGIYCIENLINNKKYIGQTYDLYHRKAHHFSDLKNNKHLNLHLQNAFNKYGKNNFIFKVLIYCESFELTKYEQFFVDLFTPEILYNTRLECVDSNLGIELSQKTKERISKANSGKIRSDEARRRLSEAKIGEKNPNYGKRGENSLYFGNHLSEETKEKISKTHLGENNYWYGKHHSDKTRQKMSDAAKRREEMKRRNK